MHQRPLSRRDPRQVMMDWLLPAAENLCNSGAAVK
jgi:hypothetical protein